MEGLEFRVLGPLEVRTGAGGALVLGRRKQRLLLAVLLLARERVPSTERLIDLLWGERAPVSATANVYSYLSDLRRVLPAGRLDGSALVVRPGELDADRFTELATQGLAAVAEQRYDVAAEQLSRALGLWRTRTVADGLPLPEALRPEATRLERLRDEVAEAAFRARLALGQHAGVVAELEDVVVRRPLDEPLWALLMEAHYLSGRRADALDAYERARKVLDDELGIEPGRALRELRQRIENSDPTLDRQPVAPMPAVPAQLPPDPAAFSGRTAELDALSALVADSREGLALAALDGMAGIGKTALAIHFAHSVRHLFPDGQLFLDLHAHTAELTPVDPAVALEHLLRGIGVPAGLLPAGLDERAALYRSRLADRRVLIVLDNAESERQVVPLLPAGPGSLVIVTSRRRLGGLDDAVPVSLDVLDVDDATGLFALVAGGNRSEGVERAEIVRLCGLLPLAVRIAAARFRARPAWTLAQFAARLRDETRRLAELEIGERSVAAAFELSHRQLTGGQQRAFGLLGLHPGDEIGLDAAAALFGQDVPAASRVLDELVDAHMLSEHRTARYRFHDLLRAYAVRRASAEPDADAAVARLLDHYAGTLSLAMDELYPHESATRPAVDTDAAAVPADPGEWLDAELGNLLATASYGIRNGHEQHTVLMSRLLYRHLRTRGLYTRAIKLHTEAAEGAGRLGDHAGELDALRGLADTYFITGRPEDAGKIFQRMRELARSAGLVVAEGLALRGLGAVHRDAGRLDEARACYDAALAAARDAGDRNGERHASLNIGHMHLLTGELGSATEWYQRSLELAVDLGDPVGEAEAFGSLGVVHRRNGDDAEALEHYGRELRLARRAGDRMSELHGLHGLGLVYEHAGDHDRALTCHREGLEIALRVGDPRWQFELHHGLGRALAAQERYAEALHEHLAALLLTEDLGTPNGRARVLHSLGSTELGLDRPDDARRHWQEALRLFTDLGAPQAAEVEAALATLDT